MEKEKMVSELETYLFDLRGYIIIKGALSQAEVGQLNAELDGMPRLEPGQWHGRVHEDYLRNMKAGVTRPLRTQTNSHK